MAIQQNQNSWLFNPSLNTPEQRRARENVRPDHNKVMCRRAIEAHKERKALMESLGIMPGDLGLSDF